MGLPWIYGSVGYTLKVKQLDIDKQYISTLVHWTYIVFKLVKKMFESNYMLRLCCTKEREWTMLDELKLKSDVMCEVMKFESDEMIVQYRVFIATQLPVTVQILLCVYK